MKIIGYRNRRDIDVEFSDGYVAIGVNYERFLLGSIKSRLYPEVLGIGYYGVGEYKARIEGVKTKSYIHWSSMLTRCYDKKYVKRSNYETCNVCDSWLNYQNFARWHEENYYSLENESVELDKDIIKRGNSIYSPDTCMYVPHKINTIICNRRNDRGVYPVGVSLYNGKFGAHCNVDGKTKFLGVFPTEMDAFIAYKTAKEAEIRRVAEMYRGKIPDQVVDNILKYTVEYID